MCKMFESGLEYAFLNHGTGTPDPALVDAVIINLEHSIYMRDNIITI
jgi:hypothetical protein